MLSLLAHAAPFNYRFPLPIWMYVAAGGAAVLLSAPAAALAVHEEPEHEWRSADVYRWFRWAGRPLTILIALLFAWSLMAGLAMPTDQSREFLENPITVVTWIDFWVGLGIAAWLVGNVWEHVSPVNVAARALDGRLARAQVQPLAYPERLGQWPAVALLLVWSWMELVWPSAKEPRVLALILIAYLIATFVGCAVFGAEAWLGNVELFSVFSRTLSRFSPLELRPFVPEEWAASPVPERTARLRLWGQGLRTDPGLPVGGGAFVLTTLATVVYDGWSQTSRFADVQHWFWQRWSFFQHHEQVLETLSMLAVVVVFVAAYVLVTRQYARILAPTLIPIAAVYFTAHYFAYFLIDVQGTLGAVVDPFGHSWNPWGLGEYNFWRGIAPPGATWWLQIVLIVFGHVAAVFAAHRIALRGSTRVRAFAGQLPVVALMVLYTLAGLWVLAQQIKA